MWKVRENSQHKWSGESDKHYTTLFLSRVQEWFDVLYNCCAAAAYSLRTAHTTAKSRRRNEKIKILSDASIVSSRTDRFFRVLSSALSSVSVRVLVISPFISTKKKYISKSVAQKKIFFKYMKKIQWMKRKKVAKTERIGELLWQK